MPRLLSPEYAAGLFDGEGSVGIYRKGKQSKGPQWRVTMTGCWLPALESLQLTYGGKVYPNRPDQNKQKYWWGVWSAEEQLAFLRTIEPHSIEKREQLLTFIKAREGIISPDVAGEQLRAMKRHVFPLEGGDGDR